MITFGSLIIGAVNVAMAIPALLVSFAIYYIIYIAWLQIGSFLQI